MSSPLTDAGELSRSQQHCLPLKQNPSSIRTQHILVQGGILHAVDNPGRMKMKKLLAFATVIMFAFSPLCGQLPVQGDFTQHYLKGVEAYTAKDFSKSIEEFEAASRISPEHIGATYNLACVYALNGRKEDALACLLGIVEKGIDPGIAGDDDLKSLRETSVFRALLSKVDQLQKPVNHSTTAFTLPEKDLITEGIAFDPTTSTFYVSSVHKRKIVRVDDHGKAMDFTREGEDSLWCCLGMAVDAARRTLWVTSTALPEMEGYDKKEDGSSGVFKFDLTKGRLSKKYILPNSTGRFNLNDIAVGKRGEVYVADGRSHGIYTIDPENDRLELLIRAPEITSPQGIAVSPDGKSIYVASYGHGVFIIDVATKNFARLNHPDNVSMAGIDALCLYNGSLIGIQNGVRPHRVSRFFLDRTGRNVEKAGILEMNNPLFNEPTLGVIANGQYYYIANSQWGSFDKEHRIFPTEQLQMPLVLKVKL
jgi:hypothetical protein